MNVLFLTCYELEVGQGRHSVLPEKMSRIKFLNGFTFFQHTYPNRTHLFYTHTPEDHERIRKEAAEYDAVFASCFMKEHYQFLEDLIQPHWTIGGPYMEQPDEDLHSNATVCDTNYEFFAGESKLTNEMEPYWYEFADTLPDIELVRATVSIGAGCYWGNCIFCDFDPTRGPGYITRPDTGKIFSKIVRKPYMQWYHLSIESLNPQQIREIGEILPDLYENKNTILHTYLRLDDVNVQALEQCEDLRGLGLTIGVEILSQRGTEIIKKGANLENLKRVCDLTHRGLSIQINVIHNWNFFDGDMFKESVYYINEINKRCKRIIPEQYLYYSHNEVCNWYPDNPYYKELHDKYGGNIVPADNTWAAKTDISRYSGVFNIEPEGESKICSAKLLRAFGLKPGFVRKRTHILWNN